MPKIYDGVTKIFDSGDGATVQSIYDGIGATYLVYPIVSSYRDSLTAISKVGVIGEDPSGQTAVSTSDMTNTTFGTINYPGAQLVKLNADGTIAWRKTAYELNYSRGSNTQHGFTNINSIHILTDGSILLEYPIVEGYRNKVSDTGPNGVIGTYYITAVSTSGMTNTTFGTVNYPGAQLVKLNADGSIAWRKTAHELNYARNAGTQYGWVSIKKITFNTDGSILLEYPIVSSYRDKVSDTGKAGVIGEDPSGQTAVSTSGMTNTTFGTVNYPGAQLVKLNADGSIAWRKTAHELNYARNAGTQYGWVSIKYNNKSGVKGSNSKTQTITVEQTTGVGINDFNN